MSLNITIYHYLSSKIGTIWGTTSGKSGTRCLTPSYTAGGADLLMSEARILDKSAKYDQLFGLYLVELSFSYRNNLTKSGVLTKFFGNMSP